MKRIIFTVFFAASVLLLFAQNAPEPPRPKNNINVNFLGDASRIAVNYERLFNVKAGFFFSGKLGIGFDKSICFFGNCLYAPAWITIPHHITANFGRKANFFEIGLGGTLNSISEDLYGPVNERYLLYPIIGYRRQPMISKKIVFRVFINGPPVNMIWGSLNQPFIPIGLSLGFTF